MAIPEKRAKPIKGKPTTYRGQHDMAGWWAWSQQVERVAMGSYEPFIKDGDLVFDIGANCGRKTWIMRELGARVVAVDPLFAFGPEFVPEFYWKFGQDAAVTVVGKAVTTERTIELAINRFMPYVSSIDRDWMTTSAHGTKDKSQPYYRETSLIRRQVPGITLDGLIGIYGIPRFMKVDIEGHENAALLTLSTPVPALNMEFHRDWIPIQAMRHLDDLGPYEWSYVLDNRGAFAAPWMPRMDLIQYMSKHLTDTGKGSWGDIYGRLVG